MKKLVSKIVTAGGRFDFFVDSVKYVTQPLRDLKMIYPTLRLPEKSFIEPISLRPNLRHG